MHKLCTVWDELQIIWSACVWSWHCRRLTFGSPSTRRSIVRLYRRWCSEAAGLASLLKPTPVSRAHLNHAALMLRGRRLSFRQPRLAQAVEEVLGILRAFERNHARVRALNRPGGLDPQ